MDKPEIVKFNKKKGWTVKTTLQLYENPTVSIEGAARETYVKLLKNLKPISRISDSELNALKSCRLTTYGWSQVKGIDARTQFKQNNLTVTKPQYNPFCIAKERFT